MTATGKIGLALGAGLSRGLAHIGVLQVLEEAGIKPDYIAGSSMGSVIGALYASGLKLGMITRLAQQISTRLWMDFTLPHKGLLAGEKLEEMLYLLTGRRSFSQLATPLAVVAVDLNSGEKTVLRKGSVARAVRASCAIPGIFSPVKIGEKLLVDGGVLQRVPASVAREMGADRVVAVDVGVNVGSYKIDHIFDVLSRSIEIMSLEIHQAQKEDADLLITPSVENIGPFDFDRVEEIIERGRNAAVSQQLTRLVKSLKEGRPVAKN
ncbi:MAG: patatin-like phospholipase family protein [Firmicutes bacterium]|nr:patatin-like phospholipase family protein [Bacillota bacterium]